MNPKHILITILISGLFILPTIKVKAESENSSNTPPSSSESSLPLSIEQIRSVLSKISSPADRFETLRSERKKTLEAISGTAASLAVVNAKIAGSESPNSRFGFVTADFENRRLPSKERLAQQVSETKKNVEDTRRRFQTAQANLKTPTAEIERLKELLDEQQQNFERIDDVLQNYEAKLEEYKKKKADAEATAKAIKDDSTKLNLERERLTKLQTTYQQSLGSLDDLVNQMFISSDAGNSFKLKMSSAFAALVGVVIVGFFAIAWSNTEIKKSIFANEAGIQFITVFSIVIAVILFGIIGVLESKELSALLGGLSGYILGKSRTNTVNSPTSNSE